MTKEIQENIDWIASGAIGCVFAATLVKKAEQIGWKFVMEEDVKRETRYIEHRRPSIVIGQPERIFMESKNIPIFPKDAFIMSVILKQRGEYYTPAQYAKYWGSMHGFYIEKVNDMYSGMRLNCGNLVSWVQYFGPDSHVKTRQAPHPMLTFALKLPAHYHLKVGFNGILHLAHASVHLLSKRAQEAMWDRSHQKTEELLGHKPTVAEAAKTTFKNM